jgi:hypothetical protein
MEKGQSMEIEQCEGYKKLLAAVEHDEQRSPKFHDYRGKLAWTVARAQQYADKTGIAVTEILDSWERSRNYWYMNYYQDAKQPEIADGKVRVFDTVDTMLAAIGKDGFRCPACKQVSKSPYECSVAPCDWKVYGLFRALGKGIYVFVKEKVAGELIFMPLAWERSANSGEVAK